MEIMGGLMVSIRISHNDKIQETHLFLLKLKNARGVPTLQERIPYLQIRSHSAIGKILVKIHTQMNPVKLMMVNKAVQVFKVWVSVKPAN